MFIPPKSHTFPQLFGNSAWLPGYNCIKPYIPWPQRFHQWCWNVPSSASPLGWCSTLWIRINLPLQDLACGESLPWILMMATNEPSWLHIGRDWRLGFRAGGIICFLNLYVWGTVLTYRACLAESPCPDFWVFLWYAGKVGFLSMSSWFYPYLSSSGRLQGLGKVGLGLWSYIH